MRTFWDPTNGRPAVTRNGRKAHDGNPSGTLSAVMEALIAEIARPDAGGFSILLEGPAGAERRMVAETIAEAADRRLFGVDLDHVVGKSIGETEKNLARAFDEAAAQGAILFFYEAEVLFGRASTRARDGLANGGPGFLLKLIAESEAVVILATTVRSALDPTLVQTTRAVLNVA
jgi:SpoVK/Ycf46/Vps4 family AAA+-type ATPase